jgi:hypothetical protein
MRCSLCELMRFAQWFWKTKSFAAFKDELIACRQVYAMTRRNIKRFYVISGSENSTHSSPFPSNPFKTSF